MFHRFFLRPTSKSVRPSPVAGKSSWGAREDEEKGRERRVHLHKSRGQHLLTNPRVLDAIVSKSGVGPSDTVLEIGPGTGNLTLKLLEKAGHVVAVEIDKRLVEILRSRVAESGLEDRITVSQFPYPFIFSGSLSLRARGYCSTKRRRERLLNICTLV